MRSGLLRSHISQCKAASVLVRPLIDIKYVDNELLKVTSNIMFYILFVPIVFKFCSQ